MKTRLGYLVLEVGGALADFAPLLQVALGGVAGQRHVLDLQRQRETQ